MIDDVLVTFRRVSYISCVQVCSGVGVNFSQYRLVKHEHYFLTFSAIPNCVSDT